VSIRIRTPHERRWADVPPRELGDPARARLGLEQHAAERALQDRAGLGRGGERELRELLLQVRGRGGGPVDAVLRRVRAGLAAQAALRAGSAEAPASEGAERTHALVRAKDADKPEGARGRDGVRVEEVERVAALGAVRDALPEPVQWHGRVREVGEPRLPLGVAERDTRRDAEGVLAGGP
jgi:hypothetical protein